MYVGCICQYGDLCKSCGDDSGFGCIAAIVYIRDGRVGQQVGQWGLEDTQGVPETGTVFIIKRFLNYVSSSYHTSAGWGAHEQYPRQCQRHLRHRPFKCRPDRIS